MPERLTGTNDEFYYKDVSSRRFFPRSYIVTHLLHLSLERPDLLLLIQEDGEEERLGQILFTGLLYRLHVLHAPFHHLVGDLFVLVLERLNKSLPAIKLLSE